MLWSIFIQWSNLNSTEKSVVTFDLKGTSTAQFVMAGLAARLAALEVE